MAAIPPNVPKGRDAVVSALSPTKTPANPKPHPALIVRKGTLPGAVNAKFAHNHPIQNSQPLPKSSTLLRHPPHPFKPTSHGRFCSPLNGDSSECLSSTMRCVFICQILSKPKSSSTKKFPSLI